MNYSDNYGLALPEDDDFYDINPISENFAALDEALAETAAETETIRDRIGTPAEAGQTVFSLLEKGSMSTIKSMQRVKVESPNKTATLSQNVVPEKCLIISERLRNSTDSLVYYDYTLYEDRLEVDHSVETQNSLRLGFWIIEFA